MSSLVSVIIPIYNMEAYLSRCLDSVMNCTYQNLEIICVDDGSKDRSPVILKDYMKRDQRIIVITKENGGLASARNAGLDCMRGEFVTFLDADDYIHPQMISLMVTAQQQTNADVTIVGFSPTSSLEPVSFQPIEYSAADCKLPSTLDVFKHNTWGSYCTARLISRKTIGSYRFDDSCKYSEDVLFNAGLWELVPSIRVCVLPYPMYYYFFRRGSISNDVQSNTRLNLIQNCLDRSKTKTAELSYFVLSICRLNRYIDYYRDSPADYRLFARKLRRCLPRVWRSKLFTSKEKLRYTFKAFLPKLAFAIRKARSGE